MPSANPPAATQASDLPDLTITTQETFEHLGAPGPKVTTVWSLMGSRRRYDRTVESAVHPSHVSTSISVCDKKLDIQLFARSRTYVAHLDDSEALLARARQETALLPASSPVGPEVVITIDMVQTGEHRQFGRFSASRTITTRTTSPGPGASAQAGRDVTDAWYVDVPVHCGSQHEFGIGVLLGYSLAPGQPPDRIRVEHRGTPPRGLPIETTEEHTSDGMTTTSRTALVSISEAPLDPAIFEVPAGYRRALPLPGGGYDPERPDTILNRASSYLDVAGRWMSSVLRLRSR